MKHGWTGLLVEPNPWVFDFLKTRNRNAWLFPNCLSSSNNTEHVLFEMDGPYSGVIPQPDGKKELTRVKCFPLASILQALDVKQVYLRTAFI